MSSDRRKFLQHISAGAAGVGLSSALSPFRSEAAASDEYNKTQKQSLKAQWLYPVNLNQVSLGKDSRLYRMAMKNADYLLSLDNDRLLYNYRVFAGLDTKGAKAYGGWEGKDFKFRGHFTGHYLSACAQFYHNFKHQEPKRCSLFSAKVNNLVNGLAACQKAISAKTGSDAIGYPGYLNAQNTDQFHRLENLQECAVPYYVIHKIMAGLLDAYIYLQNKEALKVTKGMAAYFNWRMDRLSPETIAAMINTKRYTGQYHIYFMEFGGMQDVLLNLYRATKDEDYSKLARRFEREWFNDMLADNKDMLGLNGEHSNTEIPCVIGMANNYNTSFNEDYKTGVLNFLGWMADGHEFPTGGVSGKSAYPAPLDYGGELFDYPKNINRQVNSTPGHTYHNCGESCCAHNLNKATQYTFAWTGDARWADEYEKRFINAVMSQQNPDDGMLLYNLNLKQGAKKDFGKPYDSFWCCYGTGVEAYTYLPQGAYYTDKQNGLWINRFVDGELSWPEKGLRLRQETTYPDDGYSRITFSLAKQMSLKVHVLIPAWARKDIAFKLNSKEVNLQEDNTSYAIFDRLWKDGDVLEANFPFHLHSAPMPDKREYIALSYGPHMLVNCADAGAVFNGTEQDLIRALKPEKQVCHFTAALSSGKAIFKPINKITNEQYNGYTMINQPQKEQITDKLIIGDDASEKAHRLLSLRAGKGMFKGKHWIDASDDGWISSQLNIAADKEMFLKCRYWGSDQGSKDFARLFDIQVLDPDSHKFHAVSTQSLDKEYPDNWYNVIYPIPTFLTSGRKAITVRFQAKGFEGKMGKAGGFFDLVQTHYY